MSVETIITYCLAMTLFAAAPGPGVFAVIAQSITRGIAPAFIMLSGIIIGDIAYLVAAAAGLGLLAKQMGTLFILVKFIGGAYLIWLAWQSWHAKIASPETSSETKLAQKPARFSLLGGFAISISNPKVIVFYLAFLPPFIDLSKATSSDIAMLAVITAAVLYIIMGAYILGAAKLRRTISKPTPQKWFNRLSATMMAGAGIIVATRS
jgi:threonine/homoserine/homoserine lactone efflux protein